MHYDLQKNPVPISLRILVQKTKNTSSREEREYLKKVDRPLQTTKITRVSNIEQVDVLEHNNYSIHE